MIESLDFLRICTLFFLLVAAAYTDLARGKVYNWSTYSAIIIGLLISLAIGGHTSGCPTIQSSIYGLVLGFGLFFIGYLVGGLGMGDVKLMVGIGALMGPKFVLLATVYSVMVGAVLSIGVLVFSGKLIAGIKSSAQVLIKPLHLKGTNPSHGGSELTGLTIPYGFATALGAFWTWFGGGVL